MNAVAVRVLCRKAPDAISTGSGFIVGDGLHTVTKWHVVPFMADGDPAAVVLRTADNGRVEPPVRGRDETKETQGLAPTPQPTAAQRL
jgi:S1-C subfamily serine protease